MKGSPHRPRRLGGHHGRVPYHGATMAAADPEPVELLGRPGCHLCDALWPEVQALAGRFGADAGGRAP